MIKPTCDRCREEMTEFGALYFSVPDKESRVSKKHICAKCAAVFEALFHFGPVRGTSGPCP